MFIEQKYRIRLSEVDKESKATNKTILTILEDVASKHSDLAGYGILQIPEIHLTWVLLGWKVQVIRRPVYGEEIIAKTWARGAQKYYTYRDFEVYDKDGNIIIKASSKWTLIDIKKEKIIRVDEKILEKYEIENKNVFNEEPEKLKEPENVQNEVKYEVKRSEIDINKHMHNVNYLELANEALPKEIFEKGQFDNLRITYKKEIKLGETVRCKYSYENEKHIITIKNDEDTVLHAIIELY